jgi:type IV secretory pathway TraG/TraD family ATPase VirD4
MAKAKKTKTIKSDIYNIIRTSPTRSGKSVSSVMSTILSYPGYITVIDNKGKIFNHTVKFKEAQNGQA